MDHVHVHFGVTSLIIALHSITKVLSLFVAVSEQKKSSSKVVPSRQKEKDEVGLKGPGLRKTPPTHFSDSLFCPYLCSGHPIFLSIHLSLRHFPKPITLIKHVDYL